MKIYIFDKITSTKNIQLDLKKVEQDHLLLYDIKFNE